MKQDFKKNEARFNAFEMLVIAHRNLIKKHCKLLDDLTKFRDNLPTNPAKGKDERIIEAVADEFDADPRTPNRKTETVLARQAASFLLRQATDLTWKGIAERTGVDDHATGIHNYHKAVERMSYDVDFKWRVLNAAEEIGIKNIEVPMPKTNFNEQKVVS